MIRCLSYLNSMSDQKYNTNIGDKNIRNFHFITLTFRMLVNIHFQKYNCYKFFGKLFIL